MFCFCLCSNLSLIPLLSLANPVHFPAILFSYDEFYCNASICTYVANDEVVLLRIRDILCSNLGRRPVIRPENCGSYLIPSMDMYEVVLHITSKEPSVTALINLLKITTICDNIDRLFVIHSMHVLTINISSNIHTP
jgi:hypothetical protein